MTDDRKQKIADTLGTDTDPLAKHEAALKKIDDDEPFELFLEERIRNSGKKSKTVRDYTVIIDQWKSYMQRHERHPACPNKDHIKGFVEYCVNERGNEPGTAKSKLWRLGKVYDYWKNEALWPHPSNYDPIQATLSEMDLSDGTPNDPPEISLPELRQFIQDNITHIRDRAIIVSQLKLGLRASEICNIELRDVHIDNSELRDHYPEMGTHDRLDGRYNAIYVPPSDDNDFGLPGRAGNKSDRPRILPLDDEMRRVLLDYLLIRPDVDGRPWLFLSKTNLTHLSDNKTVNRIWKRYFHPEYKFDETDRHRSVTSHFGRHYFTSHWRVRKDAPEELVKYMRGDNPAGSTSGAIKKYIHVYYSDVESLYRDNIFRLNV